MAIQGIVQLLHELCQSQRRLVSWCIDTLCITLADSLDLK